MHRPVLHQTDLFHPHQDPDDHWDLACNYALALRGDFDLRGVLIDYPLGAGDPAIAAVAQLNFLTGLTVPVMVGTSEPMTSRNDTQPAVDRISHGAVNALLKLLRESPEPVVINIVGSCRDVALAGNQNPELFAEKCAGIYLNAGIGTPDSEKATMVEYNVSLNVAAYVAIFDLPCPIYWMPCFEGGYSYEDRRVEAWGTYYCFQQEEILSYLSPRLQNYFLYMLDHSTEQNWLRCLLKPVEADLLAKCGAMNRNMWCTGGFLHAAGYTVLRDGQIAPLSRMSQDAVYTFEPIRVRCSDKGVTEWSLDRSSIDRFIFHVLDTAHYQAAITLAMCSLLKAIP